jgi:hypothetical protein
MSSVASESVLLGAGGRFFRVGVNELEKYEVTDPQEAERLRGGAGDDGEAGIGNGSYRFKMRPFPNDMVAGVRG